MRRKVYGQSQWKVCPFCSKRALATNEQGVPTCDADKKKNVPDMKCVCGEWLELRQGKWGPFFTCINCGAMNFKKGLEMNVMRID